MYGYIHTYMCTYVYTVHIHLYKCICNNYLIQNTFGVKKAQPSKVESYLEVNTWEDWRQQDLISECGQGLAY